VCVGSIGLGGLSVSIEGASKADIECTDTGDGVCSVTYHPTAPGLYVINILFADQPVQGTSCHSHTAVCLSVCLSRLLFNDVKFTTSHNRCSVLKSIFWLGGRQWEYPPILLRTFGYSRPILVVLAQ